MNIMSVQELKEMTKDTAFIDSVEDTIISINYIDMPEKPNHYIVVNFDDGDPIIYIDEIRFNDVKDFENQVEDNHIITAVRRGIEK